MYGLVIQWSLLSFWIHWFLYFVPCTAVKSFHVQLIRDAITSWKIVQHVMDFLLLSIFRSFSDWVAPIFLSGFIDLLWDVYGCKKFPRTFNRGCYKILKGCSTRCGCFTSLNLSVFFLIGWSQYSCLNTVWSLSGYVAYFWSLICAGFIIPDPFQNSILFSFPIVFSFRAHEFL